MTIVIPTTSNDFSIASNGLASSIAPAKPPNTANGDYLIAFVVFRNAGATITPPTGSGATWTAFGASDSTNTTCGTYYKKITNVAGEPSTYTWSIVGSGRVSAIIFRATGVNGSNPLDAAGVISAFTGATSLTLPAVTAGQTNTMLLCFGECQTSGVTASVFTAPSGVTTLAQVGYNNGTSSCSTWVGFQSLSSTGSTGTRIPTISPTASNSEGWMLTLAPVAGPTAAFTSSVVGTDVDFDGTGSTAVGPATISSYDWDWGDGTTHGTGSTPTHTYATAGTYSVVLTVTDSNSITGQVTHSAVVSTPPTWSDIIAVSVSTGWTPTSGTVLSVLSDVSGGAPVLTTFAASPDNPSAVELDLDFGPMSPVQPNKDLIITVWTDRINASSGTVSAQLLERTSPTDTGTQRSAITNVAVADMTASGGSGTGTSGTVATLATIELVFPWADVQSINDWNRFRVKMQGTAA